jgi:transposase
MQKIHANKGFAWYILCMPAPVIDLPEDLESLRAFALAMAEKAAYAEAEVVVLRDRETDLKDRVERLHDILKKLSRGQYGRKSEKLRATSSTDEDDQMDFLFEELATGVAALEAEINKSKAKSSPREARPRKGLPAHLERIEIIIEPEEPAEHAGKEKVKIDEDVSARLDVLPPVFRVIVTRRPKYAYKDKTIDGVLQAKAPGHIIEGGLPTEALLAHIAVSKYADGLPLYRQEAIFKRQGVEISRQQMAQWMGAVGVELTLLHDYQMKQLLKAQRLFADETVLPTLVPGTGRAQKSYLWAYVKDDRPFGGVDPPIVVFQFEDGRSGECVKRHLAGFKGILQVDGYQAYNQLDIAGVNGGIRLAGCWSHVRRYFYDLHVNNSSVVATQTVERMAELWHHENAVRGQSPAARAEHRLAHDQAIVSDLFKLWETTLPQISQKSSLAKAINYALKRRDILERFMFDGRIELDSNIVERAIRPQTITRKNSLFAGSDGGGTTWAIIASLLQTAKMNDKDPQAWMTQTLERIAKGWSALELEALMPWNFKPDTTR